LFRWIEFALACVNVDEWRMEPMAETVAPDGLKLTKVVEPLAALQPSAKMTLGRL
jgi:hypothetical protein